MAGRAGGDGDRMVHDLVGKAGGSISAGTASAARSSASSSAPPPARLAALRAIKDALDPAGIMNPES